MQLRSFIAQQDTFISFCDTNVKPIDLNNIDTEIDVDNLFSFVPLVHSQNLMITSLYQEIETLKATLHHVHTQIQRNEENSSKEYNSLLAQYEKMESSLNQQLS